MKIEHTSIRGFLSMKRKSEGSIYRLEFDLLAPFPEITHAVFLRHGGVSPPPFDSLNLCLSVGDAEKNVQSNCERVQKILKAKKIHTSKQCHGCNLIQVLPESEERLGPADGLLTNLRDQALLIKHADCQAALFYDPVQKAIGAVHSGWRSSVLNIYEKAVQRMKALYGSQPKDLRVCISPSLGPSSAEFIHYKTELPEAFYPFKGDKNTFDFWAVSRWQLEAAGVRKEHIEIAEIDTMQNTHDFFSHRGEKVTGRNGTAIVLHY